MKKISYILLAFISFIIFGCRGYAMPVLESLDIENAIIEDEFDSGKYESDGVGRGFRGRNGVLGKV